jgi:sulfatase maturation enzyme AslB (radical SAM superfamily)
MFDNDCVTCISPWYNLRIDTNGGYQYCDFSSDAEQSTELPSKWFADSRFVVAARKKIQDGTPVTGCHQCYHNESLNLDSYRQRRNFQAAVHHGNYFCESLHQSPAWNRINKLTVSDRGPSFVHVSLSNICNLACRMCSPQWSSKLWPIYKKIGFNIENSAPLLDWTDNSEKWNDFFQNIVLNNKDLICLHFMGGEPLYHHRFYQLLQDCVAANRTDFHISFVTNGTILDSQTFELLSKFKSVAIEVSIENFHETNDYIRQGSNYKAVKSNIVAALNQKTDSMSLILRTVPQALSIEHYHTVVDFALEHQLNIDSNIIKGPSLAIDVLPKHYRQRIIEQFKHKYQDLLNTHSAGFDVKDVRNQYHHKRQISYHIEKLIKLLSMPEPDNIDHLRQQFIDYNTKFDTAVDKTFSHLYPELAQYYEKYRNTDN